MVSSNGRIVISKEIRDKLGVKPGWIAIECLVEEHVEVYFIPPEHRRSLKGSLASHIGHHIPPGEEWDIARDCAWRREALGEHG
ncbi:MAG: AbrB/MazE/SpoVT family DNA-binding domain-containing protein [Dehalococcoidia bacterium]|nr:AbrB/MazE/SpoVT family DNA-binding domain-containing protein [Dehalococcoidia bacterium]